MRVDTLWKSKMTKDETARFDRLERLLVSSNGGNGHWHLKKEVTVAHILSSIAAIALILTAWYSLSGTVDALAKKTENLSDARITAVETKQELNDVHVQQALDTIGTELRLINEKLDGKADR